MSYARICTIQAHCHLRVGLERVSQLVCENFGLKIAMVLIGAHLSLSLPPRDFIMFYTIDQQSRFCTMS